MSVKLNFFPNNCEDLREEQGERFHIDINDMEKHNQGR